MKNGQLKRINSILALDRTGVSQSIKNAMTSDLEAVIREYAVLTGNLDLNVVSNGKGFTLTVSVAGESFKGVKALF